MDDSSGSVLPEGSYWLLLQALWRSGSDAQQEGDVGGFEPHGEWTSCPVADVAFFDKGFVRAWFFTAKDGALRKKKKKSLGVNELAAAFGRGTDSGFETDVVALAVFGPNGKMDEAGRRNSSMAPLDRNALRWLLDQRDSSRRAELQAIVKYVQPRGEREAVLRFDWRAQVCSFELRSAMAPLKSASSLSVVPAYQRIATHAPALVHSYKERHVPAAAVKECAAVCDALAQRLLAHRPRDQIRVCADFKLLGGDKVVLAWASAPEATASLPSTDFPASMPARALPAQSRQPAMDKAGGGRGGAGGGSASPPRARTPRSEGGTTEEPSYDSRHDVDPHLLLPQPKRRPGADGGAADGRATSAAAGAASGSSSARAALSARPATVTGGVGRHASGGGGDWERGRGRSGEAPSLRKVPGLGLMCSRYFVCRGCGKAELRSLAMQPEKDAQHARAPELLAGQGLEESLGQLASDGIINGYGDWSRPTSATISASARLASPRLKVNAADGWHRAAMCKECSLEVQREEEEARAMAAERARKEAQRQEEKERLRRADSVNGSRRLFKASDQIRTPTKSNLLGDQEGGSLAPAAPGDALSVAPAEAPAGTGDEVWPPAEAEAGAPIGLSRDAMAAAEYLRNHEQPPPKWLRPYLSGVDPSLRRPTISP
jgi:hypothetical protein